MVLINKQILIWRAKSRSRKEERDEVNQKAVKSLPKKHMHEERVGRNRHLVFIRGCPPAPINICVVQPWTIIYVYQCPCVQRGSLLCYQTPQLLSGYVQRRFRRKKVFLDITSGRKKKRIFFFFFLYSKKCSQEIKVLKKKCVPVIVTSFLEQVM